LIHYVSATTDTLLFLSLLLFLITWNITISYHLIHYFLYYEYYYFSSGTLLLSVIHYFYSCSSSGPFLFFQCFIFLLIFCIKTYLGTMDSIVQAEFPAHRTDIVE
jgi:hypothetical protein